MLPSQSFWYSIISWSGGSTEKKLLKEITDRYKGKVISGKDLDVFDWELLSSPHNHQNEPLPGSKIYKRARALAKRLKKKADQTVSFFIEVSGGPDNYLDEPL